PKWQAVVRMVIEEVAALSGVSAPVGVDAYAAGWRDAATWANRFDLIADIGSAAYERDKAAALTPAAAPRGEESAPVVQMNNAPQIVPAASEDVPSRSRL